jgi:primosomal protein N' (replication factor Y)
LDLRHHPLKVITNALHGKYGLVNLLERYGNAVLPHVELINRNTIEHSKNKGSHFSPVLVNEMLDQLKRGKQSIVFINRRGYSSMLVCTMCEWTKRCKNCDVAMTYHKYNNSFLCHYCGWHKEADPACPECGNVDLSHKGLGTQQIEEELVVLFPEATIARMDFDTVRGKAAMSDMIHRLETGKIDILIGTQMVSKGLDFENIGLVAIVSADQLARFPDFRSHERAFQLMVQVSGRSGRSEEQGKVFIQYGSIRQSLLEDVTKADYVGFYTKELAERKGFIYPPFCRLIKVVIGHRDPQKAAAAMEQFAATMKQHWGSRVVGPAPGLIPRINNQYLFELMLKVERKNEILSKIKSDVRDLALLIKSQSDYKGISCVVDVDRIR